MNFEEAIKLKTGSSVFDCFGNKLLICNVSYRLRFNKEPKNECVVTVIDSKLNKKYYSHEEVFFDQEFLSDEEKVFVEWISNNKEFVTKNQDIMHIISHCFLQGFAEGYKYKKQYNIQEMMQK